MTAINGFFNEFRFLSNFWPVEVTVLNVVFPSVEHAYQALKSTNREEWQWIASLPAARTAKGAGRTLVLRPNWDRLKVPVMRMLLRRKFAREHPELRQALIWTRDYHLEETNHWGDTFWGVCNGAGENQLGRLLMQVREEVS